MLFYRMYNNYKIQKIKRYNNVTKENRAKLYIRKVRTRNENRLNMLYMINSRSIQFYRIIKVRGLYRIVSAAS